jgi:hypothetical protein
MSNGLQNGLDRGIAAGTFEGTRRGELSGLVGNDSGFRYDNDAATYLNRIGISKGSYIYYPSTPQQITGYEIWVATSNLFIYLKANNIYSKLIAIYLYVGGTASAHKFNAINPLDTDAAFRLVFSGGNTHSATGWKPNGTNGFANTYLRLAIDLLQNDVHFSAYIRDSSRGILGGNDSSSRFSMSPDLDGTIGYHNANNAGGDSGISARSTLIKLWSISRLTSVQYKVYNNASIFSTINKPSALPNLDYIYIGARNIGGSASFFSNSEQATTIFSSGLTDAEIEVLNTGIHNFNKALHRDV